MSMGSGEGFRGQGPSIMSIRDPASWHLRSRRLSGALACALTTRLPRGPALLVDTVVPTIVELLHIQLKVSYLLLHYARSSSRKTFAVEISRVLRHGIPRCEHDSALNPKHSVVAETLSCCLPFMEPTSARVVKLWTVEVLPLSVKRIWFSCEAHRAVHMDAARALAADIFDMADMFDNALFPQTCGHILLDRRFLTNSNMPAFFSCESCCPSSVRCLFCVSVGTCAPATVPCSWWLWKSSIPKDLAIPKSCCRHSAPDFDCMWCLCFQHTCSPATVLNTSWGGG